MRRWRGSGWSVSRGNGRVPPAGLRTIFSFHNTNESARLFRDSFAATQAALVRATSPSSTSYTSAPHDDGSSIRKCGRQGVEGENDDYEETLFLSERVSGEMKVVERRGARPLPRVGVWQ